MKNIVQTYLREATIDDAKKLFDWRNDKITRKNSFNQDMIGWDEHCNWLKQTLKLNEILIYILMINDVPVGTIRGKIEKNKCIISFSIDKNYRKQGYGKLILLLFEENMINNYEAGIFLIGFVKQENIASQKTFLKAGYIKTDINEFRKQILKKEINYDEKK